MAGYLTFLTESSLEGTLLRPDIFLCIGLCVAPTQGGLRLKGLASHGKDSLKELVSVNEDTEDTLTGTQRSGNTP